MSAMPVSPDQVPDLLRALPQWEQQGSTITRSYTFPDFHHTMAFVNAVAWIAHRENHHPDLEVGYNRCRVTYTTHDAGGLSDKDFASAVLVESLLAT